MASKTFTKQDLAEFRSGKETRRNRGLKEVDGKLWYLGKEVVPLEEADAIIAKFWRDPKTGYKGRDKLFKTIREHYHGVTKKAVNEWLRRNQTSQRNQPLRKKAVSRPIITERPFQQVQVDLTDWTRYRGHNDQRKWLLTAVDLFTKKVWAEPLLDKTDARTAEGMKKILGRMGGVPDRVQSDNGGEFKGAFASLLKNDGIKQIFSISHNPTSQGAVERVQGTIKKRLEQWMQETRRKDWTNALDDILANYNSTVHKTTDLKPEDVAKDSTTHDKALKGIVKSAGKALSRTHRLFPALNVGDYVRVAMTSISAEERRKALAGHRKSSKNWTEDVYEVRRVGQAKKQNDRFKGMPAEFQRKTYSLKGLPGTFYRDRLLKSVSPDQVIKPQEPERKIRPSSFEDQEEEDAYEEKERGEPIAERLRERPPGPLSPVQEERPRRAAPKERVENVQEGEWDVEELLEMKTRNRKKMYLVKWVGFDSEENTWEPENHVKQYEKRQGKPLRALFRKKQASRRNTGP